MPGSFKQRIRSALSQIIRESIITTRAEQIANGTAIDQQALLAKVHKTIVDSNARQSAEFTTALLAANEKQTGAIVDLMLPFLQAAIPAAAEQMKNQFNGRGLEILAGTPYSRYALPVEYMPSRDFRPRWGEGKQAAIPSLMQWFGEHTEQYRSILAEMTEYSSVLREIPHNYDPANLPQPAWNNVPICPFDSAAIYTMLRHYRPKRYFEIGSGISTCFAYKAIQDCSISTKILSIDPDPRATIDAICDEVVREGLETCDMALFDQLEAGDILFFDGSHRAFMNSDVTVFFIDLLPRLKPGVIVHLHDICLPWDYPESFKSWYWNEQYMLAVYMMSLRQRIQPIFPTAFVCRTPAFDDWFTNPLVDLGGANDGWRGGGSMWFTHKA